MDEAAARVLILFGPTAAGKTAVALEVAHRICADGTGAADSVGGEVISADSRAFFRGLDIVTDKPSAGQRQGIPHHLIDVAPLCGAYDAMMFREDVARLVPEIRARGRVPMIVGGGTLYLGALLRGLFEGPGSDGALRSELSEQPVDALYAELCDVDPPAAETIHPNDRLRIERALEVYRLSGRPISAWQAEAAPAPFRFVVVGIQRKRGEHRAAIAARVRRMIEEGLVDEFVRLRAAGLTPDCQAYRTIGIPEAEAHVDGRITVDEMAERITNRTWQLARRQTAWFHREKDVSWIDVTGRLREDAAQAIIGLWNRSAEDRR